MSDTWFEIPELVAQVAELAAPAGARATWTSGPSFEEQTGRPAHLWIAICNSSLAEGPLEPMRTVAEKAAAIGVAWLKERSLVVPGIMLDVVFADAASMGPFSSFNALETFRFDVEKGGTLVPVVSELEPALEEFVRDLRYGFSGRKAPEED